MTVPAPTVGRFVQVNLGADAEPAWRPAIVTAVWPQEFSGHPLCDVGVNAQVFLDGMNDRAYVLGRLTTNPYIVLTQECEKQVESECRRGMLWVTSVPHEGVARTEQPQGVWCPTGPTWRWPPREGA